MEFNVSIVYFFGYFTDFVFCDYICPTRLVINQPFFKNEKKTARNICASMLGYATPSSVYQ